METGVPNDFNAELDHGALQLFERQQRELGKYKTRYVYLPFQDGTCYQIPRGYVPAGVIHPLPAPRGICNVRMLPEGAQTLQVISPSTGIPVPKPSTTRHFDPELRWLYERVEQLEKAALDRGSDPANLAVYLHETQPLVEGLLAYYGKEGAIEIQTLRDMPESAFEKHRLNDLLFGAESERPTTAITIRAQMLGIIERASAQTGEAARILNGVANEILSSVSTCEAMCKEHIRLRHIAMEDPNDPEPKRYSRRDFRALAFAGIARREEYKQHVALQQEKAMEAIPRMLGAMEQREQQWTATIERLVEGQERREQQWAQTFAEMSEVLSTLSGKGPKKPRGE